MPFHLAHRHRKNCALFVFVVGGSHEVRKSVCRENTNIPCLVNIEDVVSCGSHSFVVVLFSAVAGRRRAVYKMSKGFPHRTYYYVFCGDPLVAVIVV